MNTKGRLYWEEHKGLARREREPILLVTSCFGLWIDSLEWTPVWSEYRIIKQGCQEQGFSIFHDFFVIQKLH